MEEKRTKMGFARSILISIFVICTLETVSVNSAEPTASSQELFRKHQKYLQELRKLAQDGGHPDPNAITKFDPDVCYTYDCIEAGKFTNF